MQVFLSYSGVDREFVDRLRHDLVQAGIRIWIDTEDLRGAEDDRWRRGIVKGIRGSSALVLVLSPDSVESAHVERELTVAAEFELRIIPVVCRPCELPDGFQFDLAGVQRTDFTKAPFEVALDELVRRIESAERTRIAALALGSTPLPPPPPPEAALPSTAAAGTAEPPPAAAHPGAEEVAVLDGGRPENSGSRRLRSIVVAAAATIAFLLCGIVVGFVVAARGDGNEGGATQLTATSASAPPVTDRATTTSRVSPPGSPTTGPIAEAATSESQARQPIEDLAAAYTGHDWPSVRRINTHEASMSDAEFERFYGKVVEESHVVLDIDQRSPARWTATGAVIALKKVEGEEHSTNVACARWDVNASAGTAAATATKGSDGELARLIDGWIPKEEYDETAASYCG
jgi:hypothetical protein